MSPHADADNSLGDALVALGDEMIQGLLIMEPDGRVRFANPAARQIFGWEQAGEMSLASIPDDEVRSRLSHDRGLWVMEATIRGDASPLPVSIFHRPIERGGGPAGSLLLITDLRELRAAVAERDQARKNDQAKTRSLHMVAHDLSGPMTILNGYISMVLDGTIDIGQLESYLPLLAAQLDQMQRLLQVLLDTARLEEGRIELVLEPVDLGAFVERMVGAMPAPETGHRVLVRRDSSPLPVLADPVRLDSIVRNLVSNAIKYSPEGTTVTCTLRAVASDATLEVVDQGAGISADDLKRLFSRFGRVGDTTTNPAGVGLGLFLSRELARLHGGDVLVASEPGKGSRFTLRLPLNRAVGR